LGERKEGLLLCLEKLLKIKDDAMFRGMEKLRKSSRQTKFFIFTAIIYSLAIILTAIYAYGRLDFVRNNQITKITTELNHDRS